MRIRFLNPAVEATVSSDPHLRLAWYLTEYSIDTETDPVHNPDWVAHRIKDERRKLARLRERLLTYTAEYPR